jgi:hypothetical protein
LQRTALSFPPDSAGEDPFARFQLKCESRKIMELGINFTQMLFSYPVAFAIRITLVIAVSLDILLWFRRSKWV